MSRLRKNGLSFDEIRALNPDQLMEKMKIKNPLTGDNAKLFHTAVQTAFQNVDVKRAKARAIYTRMSGSHEVTVIQTDKAIHFIENVAGMYLMTSVHSCLIRRAAWCLRHVRRGPFPALRHRGAQATRFGLRKN